MDAPLPIRVTPAGKRLAKRIRNAERIIADMAAAEVAASGSMGDPVCYPSDAEYLRMQMEQDAARFDGLEQGPDDNAPTLAERLAESMKDDRRP
jgi:hypothetical protein